MCLSGLSSLCHLWEKKSCWDDATLVYSGFHINLCQKRRSNRKFEMLLLKKVFGGTCKVLTNKKENLIRANTNCTASKGKLTIYDEFLFSLREFPNILIDPSFIGTISSIKNERFFFWKFSSMNRKSGLDLCVSEMLRQSSLSCAKWQFTPSTQFLFQQLFCSFLPFFIVIKRLKQN